MFIWRIAIPARSREPYHRNAHERTYRRMNTELGDREGDARHSVGASGWPDVPR
jgi:hypothetical protein